MIDEEDRRLSRKSSLSVKLSNGAIRLAIIQQAEALGITVDAYVEMVLRQKLVSSGVTWFTRGEYERKV